MAAIILVLLFSAEVLAQHQPPLALKFRQDSSDLPIKTPGAISRQISVEKHQDDSDIIIKSVSDHKENQMTVKSELQSGKESSYDADAGCVLPFVTVGHYCYLFSTDKLRFTDAKDYCEALSEGHIYDVSLAMMDYESSEDQALLDAVTERNNTFWLGGTTEDGVNWSWLDDRPISLQSTNWDFNEPDNPTNKCVTAHTRANYNIIKSYLYDSQCSDSFNFICQTNLPINFNFKRIGNKYFFSSEEAGLPETHWQDAHSYCKGLLTPIGYHADLAVLSLTYDDYDFMFNLAPADTTGYWYAWIGAVAEVDCTYEFIDGTPLPVSSPYWHYDAPSCGSDKYVALRYNAPTNRTTLRDQPEDYVWPFICQLFKNV